MKTNRVLYKQIPVGDTSVKVVADIQADATAEPGEELLEHADALAIQQESQRKVSVAIEQLRPYAQAQHQVGMPGCDKPVSPVDGATANPHDPEGGVPNELEPGDVPPTENNPHKPEGEPDAEKKPDGDSTSTTPPPDSKPSEPPTSGSDGFSEPEKKDPDAPSGSDATIPGDTTGSSGSLPREPSLKVRA